MPIAELAVGDTVLVRSGARVSADGQIVAGTAEFDEALITGESRPVERGAGETVVAGTVATDNAVRVRIEATVDGAEVLVGGPEHAARAGAVHARGPAG